MTSRLGWFCDRFIEAGCLAALVGIPLFFNPHSARIFEPDKALVLRFLAVILLVAWAVKALERWPMRPVRRLVPARPGHPHEGLLRRPLWLPALLAFLGSLVAAVLSIAPHLSVWGSYERLQGLVTTASYAVVFFSLAAVVRTVAQVERAISAALLASFPIATYGVLQHFGLDPIPWGHHGRSPSTSTLGNILFTAGFLVVTVPLCLYRLTTTARGIWPGLARRGRRAVVALSSLTLAMLLLGWVAHPFNALVALAVAAGVWLYMAGVLGQPRRVFLGMAVYLTLLSVQLACIVVTQSRGPFLALLGGVFALGWLLTLAEGRWRTNLLVTGGGVLTLLALLLMNVPHPAVGWVREVPMVGRLTHVLDTENNARVRILIWSGVTELLASDAYRLAVGRGPETLRLAFYAHYRPELAHLERQLKVPDRAHNDTLDALAETGLLGLSLRYLFILALLALVKRRLGLIGSRRDFAMFVGLCLGSAASLWSLAGLGFGAWFLGGLALPFGILMGVVFYGVTSSLVRSRRARPGPASAGPERLLAATLGSAVLVHFIEIQFGLATTASTTYFWAYAGLLAASARFCPVPSPAATRADTPAPDERAAAAMPAPISDVAATSPRAAVAADSLLVALLLTTLVFVFTGAHSDALRDPRALALLVASFAFGGLLVLVEPATAGDRTAPRWSERLGVYASVSLVVPIAAYGMFRFADSWDARVHPGLVAYGLLLVMLLGLYAWLGPSRRDLARGQVRRPRRVAQVAVALLGLGVVRIVCLDPAEADIRFRRGIEAHARRALDDAARRYREALDLAPKEDRYHAVLAQALIERAIAAPDAPGKDGLFSEAEHAIRTAGRLSPMDPDHAANLARLHTSWALLAGGRQEHVDRLATAAEQYERAIGLHPRLARLRIEAGQVSLLRGRPEDAIERYREALEVDPASCGAYQLLAAISAEIGDDARLREARQNGAACARRR
jgi:hypothetical protein